jgi:hypothetical protein
MHLDGEIAFSSVMHFEAVIEPVRRWIWMLGSSNSETHLEVEIKLNSEMHLEAVIERV